MIDMQSKLIETDAALEYLRQAKVPIPDEAMEIREMIVRCIAAESALANNNELALFRWMVEMRLTVSESAFFNYPHGKKWCCMDVDGEIIGNGTTALNAIEAAHKWIDDMTDEAFAEIEKTKRNVQQAERADVMRDRKKDGE